MTEKNKLVDVGVLDLGGKKALFPSILHFVAASNMLQCCFQE